MKKTLLLMALLLFSPQLVQAKDYTPQECPVVGNTHSHIYHVAGDHS